MGYQQIIIQGNLTDNVQIRQVGQGQVIQGSVAVSEKFRKQDGTVGESTEFFDVEIWNKPNVAQYLLKGTPVLITGKVKTDSWQDQQGQKHSTKKVRVDVIQLCGGRPQAQAPQPQYVQAPAAPASYQQPTPPPPAYQPAPAPQPAAPAYSAPAPQAPADNDLPF